MMEKWQNRSDLFCQFGCRWSGLVKGENGIIFDLNMSGEMHMRRRNEVFGCIPHGRGALEKWQKRSDLF